MPAVTAACQDPEIPRWTVVPRNYTERHARDSCHAEGDLAAGRELDLAIVETGDPVLGAMGMSNLTGPTSRARSATGSFRGPPARGGVRATRMLAEWALTGLGLGGSSCWRFPRRGVAAARRAGGSRARACCAGIAAATASARITEGLAARRGSPAVSRIQRRPPPAPLARRMHTRRGGPAIRRPPSTRSRSSPAWPCSTLRPARASYARAGGRRSHGHRGGAGGEMRPPCRIRSPPWTARRGDSGRGRVRGPRGRGQASTGSTGRRRSRRSTACEPGRLDRRPVEPPRGGRSG